MYEQMKNEFIANLGTEFSAAQLQLIGQQLDVVAYHYDVKQKETGLSRIEDTDIGIVQAYLVAKKIEGLSDLTLKNYRLTLRNFMQYVNKPFNKVNANDIRVFLYTYQQERGCTNRSMDKIRQYLNSFFTWAAAEDYISKIPTASVVKIKYEVKPRKAMTQEQLEYIRMSCKSKRDTAIVAFLYSTGCRVSELCNVKKSDIQFSKNKVELFGKGKKYRKSYINAKARVAINEYLETRDDDCEYLFVTERKPYRKMGTRSVEDIVKRLWQDSKIHEDIHVTPHIFRHTMATQALQSGMDAVEVQKILGHSKLDTTMIYAEVNEESIQLSHAKYVV